MIYKQLALMLTDKCTAACAFCGLRCNQKNDQVISFEFAKRVIDEVVEMGTFERIGLSGGEVFIYPDLVKQILEYAKEKGIERRTVATNGFWGGWSDEKLDEVLSGMKDCLTEVAFSHDAFHAEYVKSENIYRAIRFLSKYDIKFSVHVADVYGDKGAGPFLASLDDYVFYMHYKLYPLAAMGNAENLPDEIFVRAQNWDQTVCYPEGILSVHCNGSVYPCCCPGVFDTGFNLGNINDKPLKEILNNSEGMRYINVMADPVRFVKMLKYANEELGINVPEKAVNGCELCYKVFHQPDAYEKLKPFFEKEYKELLMEKLFNKEEK